MDQSAQIDLEREKGSAEVANVPLANDAEAEEDKSESLDYKVNLIDSDYSSEDNVRVLYDDDDQDSD